MGAEEISNRKIMKAMSKIKLDHNSLLMIKKGSELAKNIDIKQLTTVIKQMGLVNIGILIVDNFADIGKIPQHKLNKLGYFQIGDVGKKIMQMKGMTEDKESDEIEE